MKHIVDQDLLDLLDARSAGDALLSTAASELRVCYKVIAALEQLVVTMEKEVNHAPV